MTSPMLQENPLDQQRVSCIDCKRVCCSPARVVRVSVSRPLPLQARQMAQMVCVNRWHHKHSLLYRPPSFDPSPPSHLTPLITHPPPHPLLSLSPHPPLITLIPPHPITLTLHLTPPHPTPLITPSSSPHPTHHTFLLTPPHSSHSPFTPPLTHHTPFSPSDTLPS